MNCKIDDTVKECTFDETGKDITTGCVLQPNGTTSCPQNVICGHWQLSQNNDTCIMSDYITESLTISGATINVHKLLGVHEQGLLVDITGYGSSIASSYLPNFPPKNAFEKYITEWRSVEAGINVLKKSFIGYDFGPYRLDNGRERYGLDTYVLKDVSMIKMIQSCNKNNRATKIRLERSFDNIKWFGAAILDVPDCDGLVTLNFNSTVPSRFWRIRPITFNGSENDYWAVQAIQFLEYEKTDLSNIQDKFLMENRDRSYQVEPIEIKGSYTPLDVISNQSKFGFMFNNDTYVFEISFKDSVAKLGRPIVIGDILELPSEIQYNSKLEPIKKYLDVSDVSWASSGFSPTWQPLMQKISATPAFATQENQDIMGKLTRDYDETGLFDIDDGLNNKKYQDYSDVSQTLMQRANQNVPLKGVDFADVPTVSQDVLDWGEYHNKDMSKFNRKRNLYGIDALPPDGLPYTEGDSFPEKPSDGDYHRLTYSHINNNIPARLHRWSKKKKKWIFLEFDHKQLTKDHKPQLTGFNDPYKSSVTSLNDINTELFNKDS